MCGLGAIITAGQHGFSTDEQNSIMPMMALNQFRGMDSTGVVGVSNKGEAKWLKSVGGPNWLWSEEKWSGFMQTMFSDGRLFFTHGRSATKGNVSETNAHPFRVGRKEDKSCILLVHNGTLTDNQPFEGLDNFKVDSEFLAHCVVKYGPEETFKKINGPIATMWWDTQDLSFNVFKNYERPLYFAKTHGGSIFIASERETLEYLKIKFHLGYAIKDIGPVPPHEWWKLKIIKDKKEVSEWQKRTINKEYSYPKTQWTGGHGHYQYSHDDYDDEGESIVTPIHPVTRPITDPKIYNDARVYDYVVFKDNWNYDIIKRLLDKEIFFVEWDDKTNVRTESTQDGRISFQNSPSQEPGLIRLFRQRDGVLTKVYQEDKGVFVYSSIRPLLRERPANHGIIQLIEQPAQVVTPPAILLPKNERRRMSLGLVRPLIKSVTIKSLGTTLKCGKEIKFNSKLPDGKVMKCNGRVSNLDPYFFEWFKTSEDGLFKVEDDVNLIVDYVSMYHESDKKKLWRVDCSFPQDPSRGMNFYFISAQDKPEIEQLVTVKGKIKSLKFTSDNVRIQTGAVVDAQVTDLVLSSKVVEQPQLEIVTNHVPT